RPGPARMSPKPSTAPCGGGAPSTGCWACAAGVPWNRCIPWCATRCGWPCTKRAGWTPCLAPSRATRRWSWSSAAGRDGPRASSDEDPVEALAVVTSHPRWLVRRWVERFGIEEAKALCEANNETPPLHIRTNTLKIQRGALAEMLEAAGAEVALGPLAPE